MNRPSRTDEPYEGEGYNQSPNDLSNDLTTNQDLNGIVNARALEPGEDDKGLSLAGDAGTGDGDVSRSYHDVDWGKDGSGPAATAATTKSDGLGLPEGEEVPATALPTLHSRRLPSEDGGDTPKIHEALYDRVKKAIVKFGSFIGPGFMIAVAYSEIHPRFLPS